MVTEDAKAAIKRTLIWEGGWSNDPDDHGGATKYGITQNTLSRWRKSFVSERDVRGLSLSEAEEIYAAWYWDGPGISSLPRQEIREAVYDFGVNSGPNRAIKALQRVVGAYPDGVIGPQTIAAVVSAIDSDGWRYVLDKFCDRRAMFYKSVVRAKPSQVKFLRGWMRRCDAFRPEHLGGVV